MFAIPTVFLTGLTFVSDPPIKLDFTLSISSASDDLEYNAKYSWDATGIDANNGVTSIQWSSKSASAKINSQGQLTETIKSYFESVTISLETTLLQENGEWSINLQKQLCSGVSMGVEINGDESEVSEITPYLISSIMPVSLKSALRSIGLYEVDLVVKIEFHIRGDLLEEGARNLGIVIDFWTGLVSKTVEVSLGTLSALGD